MAEDDNLLPPGRRHMDHDAFGAAADLVRGTVIANPGRFTCIVPGHRMPATDP